jgi:kynurenine formamidase
MSVQYSVKVNVTVAVEDLTMESLIANLSVVWEKERESHCKKRPEEDETKGKQNLDFGEETKSSVVLTRTGRRQRRGTEAVG